MEPDNSRPVMTEDISVCAVCGRPARGWAETRARDVFGACGDECRAVIGAMVPLKERS